MNNTETKETICIDDIDQSYKDIVTMNNLKAGETGPVITIKAPKDKKIKIVGTTDPSLNDRNDAYTLIIRLSDKDDIAIDFMTKMIMTHEKSNDSTTISNPFYGDINMIRTSSFYEDPDLKKEMTLYRHKTAIEWYRLKYTLVLNEGEKFIISAINPNRDIEKIKFAMWADIVTL